MMNFLYFLFLALLLGSCHHSSENQATLSGDFHCLNTDTAYFYGSDDHYQKIDTIYLKNGKFKVTLPIDTPTYAYLYIQSIQKELPVFINKKENIHLVSTQTDSLTKIQAEGNPYTQELYDFLNTIQEEDSLTVKKERAKNFITRNPYSLADIYLIDKFFLQQKEPYFLELDSLTQNLSGLLKDTPYITRLMKFISDYKKVTYNSSFYYFNLPSNLGRNITRMNTFQGKYLLIHFWASWDEASRKLNRELRDVYKTFRKDENFDMLGISLDTDPETWEKAIQTDSLSWTQAYMSEGLIKDKKNNYAIHSLPSVFLVDKVGRIKLQSDQLNEISDSLRVILKKHKQR